MDGNNLPIDEFQQLLDELDALAPTREQPERIPILLRNIEPDQIVDDSFWHDDWVNDDTPFGNLEVGETSESTVKEFSVDGVAPVVSIDCGIVRLGETENGLVIALRAAIIVDDGEQSQVQLFRTGPMYLNNLHKLQILHRMGVQLGKSDLFVEIQVLDEGTEKAVRVKSGVAQDSHKFGDRFRNWFERLAQKVAAQSIRNGTVLLDGALTLRTIDTPDIFLHDLANLCSQKGNALIAVSKQSLLQVQERPIRFWLDENPLQPSYRCLTPLMSREERMRVLGNAYAVRFSPLGPTFRMDVKPVDGQTDDEAINRFFSSSLMRGGYPDILVRAHAHSYFTSPDVIQLQAQASSRYSLIPRRDVDLSGIFGPFGGRFK
jgi:hypothetical protein